MRELIGREISLVAGGDLVVGFEPERRLPKVTVTAPRIRTVADEMAMRGIVDLNVLLYGPNGQPPLDGGGGVASLENIQSGQTDYDHCLTQQQGALDAANAQVQFWSEALEYYMTETVPDNSRVPGSGDIIEAGAVFWAFNN